MELEKQLFDIVKRIRALSQTGLVYSTDNYSTERYEELIKLSNEMTALISGNEISVINNCFVVETDYVTPKVDVRGVVFDENDKILLVKESADGLWSIPGGWADVGLSPSENVIREIKEETGLDVTTIRLLSVLDKKCHPHPPHMHYAYKIFILCEIVGGEFNLATHEILDKGFFLQDDLPPLSEERILKSQIDMLFEYHYDEKKTAHSD